ELRDRAASLAGFHELERAILYQVARGALARHARTKLGDGVFARVRIAPDAVRVRELRIVRRGRHDRRHDFGRWKRICRWAREGIDARNGRTNHADVVERRERADRQRDDAECKEQRIPHYCILSTARSPRTGWSVTIPTSGRTTKRTAAVAGAG